MKVLPQCFAEIGKSEQSFNKFEYAGVHYCPTADMMNTDSHQDWVVLAVRRTPIWCGYSFYSSDQVLKKTPSATFI